jgi:predicted SprT family Zn-dependent metalloprotease
MRSVAASGYTHVHFNRLNSGRKFTSESEARCRKRVRKNGKSNRVQDGRQTDCQILRCKTEKKITLSNFDTVGGILIYWLLHYTVFCERKNYKISNADTRLNTHALLLQPKRNNFISDSIQGRTGSSLHICHCFAIFFASHVCTHNAKESSDLLCVHCTQESYYESNMQGAVSLLYTWYISAVLVLQWSKLTYNSYTICLAEQPILRVSQKSVNRLTKNKHKVYLGPNFWSRSSSK